MDVIFRTTAPFAGKSSPSVYKQATVHNIPKKSKPIFFRFVILINTMIAQY
jgi:hypothetical protein